MSRPCHRSLVASWKDSSLGLGILAMELPTVRDAHVPWRSLCSLHLQCSGSWIQVWDRPRGRQRHPEQSPGAEVGCGLRVRLAELCPSVPPANPSVKSGQGWPVSGHWTDEAERVRAHCLGATPWCSTPGQAVAASTGLGGGHLWGQGQVRCSRNMAGEPGSQISSSCFL